MQVCVVAVGWGVVTTRGSQILLWDGHDLPFPRVLGSRVPSRTSVSSPIHGVRKTSKVVKDSDNQVHGRTESNDGY